MSFTQLQLSSAAESLQNFAHYRNARLQHTAAHKQQLTVGSSNYTEYRALLDTASPSGEHLADQSKAGLRMIRMKVQRYCKFHNIPNWREFIKNCDLTDIKGFIFHERFGSNLHSEGSLHQYLLKFRMLYELVNKRSIQRDVGRAAYEYMRWLLTKWPLLKILKSKPVIGRDEFYLMLRHHWGRDRHVYAIEKMRIYIAIVFLALAYTGGRPAEFVESRPGSTDIFGDDDTEAEKGRSCFDLFDGRIPCVPPLGKEERSKVVCYEDIELWMVRDPELGNRDILAIILTLSHHKGADNKPRPTKFLIVQNKNPMLCFVSHVVAVAIDDQAFKMQDGIPSSKALFQSDLSKSSRQAIRCHWKEDMLKVPLVRRAVPCELEFRDKISPLLPLQYNFWNESASRIGDGTGLEESFGSYWIRRSVGNEVDTRETEVVRNQIMRHKDSSTFGPSYSNGLARCDVQGAFLDEPSHDGLMKAFAHMALTCDPNAPLEVPSEIMESLPPDPDITTFETEYVEIRNAIKDGYGTITRAPSDIQTECKKLRSRLDYAIKKQRKEFQKHYRRDYFIRSHDEEFIRQIHRTFEDNAGRVVQPMDQLQLPERTRLVELFNKQPTTVDDAFKERYQVIDAMVALMDCRELKRPKRKSIRPASQISLEQNSLTSAQAPSPAPATVPLECGPTECIFCGRHLATPSAMRDHVERHLAGKDPSAPMPCPHSACNSKEWLDCIAHFKNHAFSVHRVTLRKRSP